MTINYALCVNCNNYTVKDNIFKYYKRRCDKCFNKEITKGLALFRNYDLSFNDFKDYLSKGGLFNEIMLYSLCSSQYVSDLFIKYIIDNYHSINIIKHISIINIFLTAFKCDNKIVTCYDELKKNENISNNTILLVLEFINNENGAILSNL